MAKLYSLEKAVRMAYNVSLRQVHVFSDSNLAICQLMLFKCQVGMVVQVCILKRIV